ncbi:MAG: hypothetical protein ABSA17_08890 [Rhabdochlamydiaceae bacterium]
MLKKSRKKVSKATSRKREKRPSEPTKLLSAEGWKRLMMKKHRT